MYRVRSSRVFQINLRRAASQVTPRSADSVRASRIYFSSGWRSSRRAAQIIQPVRAPNTPAFVRCAAVVFFRRLFSRRENVLRQFDLAEGCAATCPFRSLSLSLSHPVSGSSVLLTPSAHCRPLRLPFSLCLYFVGAAVICCDKAASTGDARVSRVEGHALLLSLS